MVRSSSSRYAAAGTDPPWPPLLKGGKLGATHAGGKHRPLARKFSTDHPDLLPEGEGEGELVAMGRPAAAQAQDGVHPIEVSGELFAGQREPKSLS